MNKSMLIAVTLSVSVLPLHARADSDGSTLEVSIEPQAEEPPEVDKEPGSVGPYAPGPNMAAELVLRSKQERMAEHARRLKIATYTLTAAGLAAGTWAIASGVRGHQIDDACAGEGSCSHATAAHGRMLYRSADAGAALGAACGISAAVLLWRYLTVSSSDDWRSANVWPFVF